MGARARAEAKLLGIPPRRKPISHEPSHAGNHCPRSPIHKPSFLVFELGPFAGVRQIKKQVRNPDCWQFKSPAEDVLHVDIKSDKDQNGSASGESTFLGARYHSTCRLHPRGSNPWAEKMQSILRLSELDAALQTLAPKTLPLFAVGKLTRCSLPLKTAAAEDVTVDRDGVSQFHAELFIRPGHRHVPSHVPSHCLKALFTNLVCPNRPVAGAALCLCCQEPFRLLHLPVLDKSSGSHAVDRDDRRRAGLATRGGTAAPRNPNLPLDRCQEGGTAQHLQSRCKHFLYPGEVLIVQYGLSLPC